MTVFTRYWGKAKPKADTGPQWHLLVYHSLDVAAVGEALLTRHCFMRQQLAKALGIEVDKLVPIVKFLLAIHDLGKFAEAFQQLRPDLRDSLWPDGHIRLKDYSLRHDSLGYLLWTDYLSQVLLREGGLGFSANASAWNALDEVLRIWLACANGHHGIPPQSSYKAPKTFFRDFDIVVARCYLERAFQLCEPDLVIVSERAEDRMWLQERQEKSWLLAGFCVLCDWLGSDVDFFPYHTAEMPLPKYWQNCACPNAAKSIEQCGIIPAPANTAVDTSLFETIRNFTPLQQKCAKLPLTDTPQLFILEDVTGSGKTEAALILAQKIFAQQLAQGLYIGLPTMATANAMFARMTEVYRRFFIATGKPSIVLAHSTQHLVTQYSEQILPASEAQSRYSAEDKTASSYCAEWITDHRKAALLADVGIGTLDQALLGVLPVRHQSMRLLGLANKLLIVDEIHAYDAYMQELLQALLAVHARQGGSAILLSATLPKQQKQKLVDAFAQGLGQPGMVLKQKAYPLLAHYPVQSEIAVPTRAEVARWVGVRLMDSTEDVYRLLQAATERGQCVCWIRNTVHDARAAFADLQEADWISRDKIMLFHSRYALCDRLAIEEQVLRCFGKSSTADDRAGKILIATQVIEQSLDLDFDCMISDLAPIDLLIQRAGRLQRHIRDQQGNRLPEQGAQDQRPEPLLHVLSPTPEDDPADDWYKALFPKANYVYPHTGQLWLTVRLLNARQGWTMPDDARDLIEGVYGEAAAEIPQALEKASQDAESERLAATNMANFNTLAFDAGYGGSMLYRPWDSQEKIPTRLAEDSVAVFLAIWENHQLKPWAKTGRFLWDLSSVNIRAKQLTKLSDDLSEDVLTAIANLKNDHPRFNEHSLIIPLMKLDDPGDDKTASYTASGLNSKGEAIQITYNLELGLCLE